MVVKDLLLVRSCPLGELPRVIIDMCSPDEHPNGGEAYNRETITLPSAYTAQLAVAFLQLFLFEDLWMYLESATLLES